MNRFFIGLVVLVAGWGTKAPAQGAVNLRCEYLVDPQGVTEAAPRLTWEPMIPGIPAWRVRVCSSKELLDERRADLWDSGRVEEPGRNQVVYQGPPLRSGQECWWVVEELSNSGDAYTVVSSPARWTMGLLEEKDWEGAEWIGLPGPEEKAFEFPPEARWIAGEEGLKAPVGSRAYRTSFDAPANLERALLLATGDDDLVVWLNATQVLTVKGHQNGQRLDVTSFLKPGASNSIAATARNASAGPTGILVAIEMEAGGKTTRIVSNSSWRTQANPPAGWEKAAEPPGAGWTAATELAAPGQGPWGALTIASPESRVLPARLVRIGFGTEDVVSATLHVAGLGYHEVYLDGEKIGDRELEPALMDYDVRVPVATYGPQDGLAKPLARNGAHGLVILLGNGRYHAPRSKVPTGTRDFGVPVARAVLLLTKKDGQVQRIVTNASWKATDGGSIRENNDYDGEVFDSRPQGQSFDKWPPARILPGPKGRLAPQMLPPTRVTERLQPKEVYEKDAGKWIYDFGENLVGRCELKVEVPAGTRITLRHAETTTPDGNLYTANLRSAQCRDVYVANGKGVETYHPHFTYHGFRFVEMTGYPGRPPAGILTACKVNTDLTTVGEWDSSSPTLNRLFLNYKRGLLGNYRSIPTDCPQRDERQGWQGDRAAESLGEAYLFDVSAFYAKWLQDIEDSQKPDGNVSDVCPAYWPFYSGSTVWPAVQTVLPETLWLHYGDQRLLERHYASTARWVEFQWKRRDANGLVPPDPYGDWCPPPEDLKVVHTQAPDRVTDKAMVANAYLCLHLQKMAWLAGKLGRAEDVARWTKLRTQAAAAFQKAYWKAESHSFANGTQTSYVLPMAFGLVPSGQEKAVAEALVGRIRGHDKGHIGTGLIGAQWLNRTLSERGFCNVAYEMATRTDYPSWGYMVEHGATTFWELWNGNTADPSMNSGNHVMLVGDMGAWFFENLAGIRCHPDHPGFGKVLVQPDIPAGLESVTASYHSIRGLIKTSWKSGNAFSLTLTLPPGVPAEVRLPLAERDLGQLDIYDGNVKSEARAKLGPRVGDRQSIELEPGTHTISVSVNPFPHDQKPQPDPARFK